MVIINKLQFIMVHKIIMVHITILNILNNLNLMIEKQLFKKDINNNLNFTTYY